MKKRFRIPYKNKFLLRLLRLRSLRLCSRYWRGSGVAFPALCRRGAHSLRSLFHSVDSSYSLLSAGDDDVTRFWAGLGGSFGCGQSAEWQASPAPWLWVLAGSLAKLEEQDDEDDDDEEEDDTASSDGSEEGKFGAENSLHWPGTVILVSCVWKEKKERHYESDTHSFSLSLLTISKKDVSNTHSHYQCLESLSVVKAKMAVETNFWVC